MTDNAERDRLSFVVGDEPPTTAEERVALRVRALRQAKGLSQAELAQRMSAHGFTWHQTTVAKTERADRPLRVNEAEALAMVLAVPLLDLLTDPPPGADVPTDVAVAQQLLTLAEHAHAEAAALHAEMAEGYAGMLGRAEEVKRLRDEALVRRQASAAELAHARQAYQDALAAAEPTRG